MVTSYLIQGFLFLVMFSRLNFKYRHFHWKKMFDTTKLLYANYNRIISCSLCLHILNFNITY